MRKTYDMKQIKISTSILWLLNKAETRNVFISSMDIFSDKTKLHLHSLIIRGLISGELYCAALTKLFPFSDRPIKTKNFNSILDFIIKSDTSQLQEIAILNQKNRETFVENLTKMEPFELSEHLQVIDAIMSLCLGSSEHVTSIPTILSKLCDYRPIVKDSRMLLEIWFKSIVCLSLSRNNIKDTSDFMKSIIIQEGMGINDKKYMDTIKFSDKVALIMNYESETLKIDKEFIFQFSEDGSTNRDNIKHNFVTVIYIFRRYFPKVLEDFKELMLILNSSHIQISNNLSININIFLLEFFTCLEDISNHGSRTFRTGYPNSEVKEIAPSRTFRVENPVSLKDKLGIYHTLNKPPAQVNDKYSKHGAFGTYSGRKQPPMDFHEEQSTNWVSQRTGNNLLSSGRKGSVPNGLNWVGVNKITSQVTDGTLKTKFLSRKSSVEKVEFDNNNKMEDNQTTWQLQSDKASKEGVQDTYNNYEMNAQKSKLNETRLRLNMKRQEIEENRRQLHHQLSKERQHLSDRVFRDVTMGISQIEDGTMNNHKRKRVSDVKRGRDFQKADLTRSRSQEFSKSSVEDINVSLNQLREEISKLTTEQARLSAKISENKVDNSETFSPRLDQSATSREEGFDNKIIDGSSVKSMPMSWHHYNNFVSEDLYSNQNIKYVPKYSYPIEPTPPKFYHPYNPYPPYPYPYGPEISSYHIPPPMHSINPAHVAKSLLDNNNSRPTSPGALSEPSKTREIIPVRSVEVTDTEPLTIQNLIKHNKSMEKLPKNVICSDKISQKSLVQHTVDNNLNQNSISDFSISSSIQPKTNNNDTITSNNNINSREIDVTDNSSKRLEASKTVSGDEKKIVTETEKKPIEVINDSNLPENSKTFFVSFDDDKSNKKPLKKPRIRDLKEYAPNNKNINSKNDHNTLRDNSTQKPVSKSIEKPLAFLINMDDEKPLQQNGDSDLTDKLLHLTQKREQERKEKLKKIREAKKQENEERLQKELEKEKLKEEKKRKREAIYEAHLIKKLEKESSDKQNRRDVKSFRKFVRTIPSTPSIPKDFINHNFMDSNMHLDSNFPDLLNINKREKLQSNISGPKLFVEPKVKSNKNVILNAIKYCCLAGKVNESLKQQTIEELERLDASHFIILMRGGCQYRSLYMFEPDSECLIKLTGVGPKKITNKMVEKFFKYNSGAKKFMEITSTNHLSTVIDGITIFNTLWKSNNPITSQLNSSETSSQA